jgi:hypothetical protein
MIQFDSTALAIFQASFGVNVLISDTRSYVLSVCLTDAEQGQTDPQKEMDTVSR